MNIEEYNQQEASKRELQESFFVSKVEKSHGGAYLDKNINTLISLFKNYT